MNKDLDYLTNPNATKNPKLFNLTLWRDEKGNFHAVGNQSLILSKRGTSEKWERVNTRAIAKLLNEQGISAR